MSSLSILSNGQEWKPNKNCTLLSSPLLFILTAQLNQSQTHDSIWIQTQENQNENNFKSHYCITFDPNQTTFRITKDNKLVWMLSRFDYPEVARN